MFRCCCNNGLGTWRSMVAAVVVSAVAGGIAALLPMALGREPGDEATLSRWLGVSAMLLGPTWAGFGLTEGRRCRRRTDADNPFRPEHEAVDGPAGSQ